MSTAVGIPRKWTVADSAEVYGTKYWGHNYFSIAESGNAVAHPAGTDGPAIDLKELVDEVARRGIGLPLLIRFRDVLRRRVVELNETFRDAIVEYGYKGEFKGVYPIKVNQHRDVIEEIARVGARYHYGLECGSKAELLIALAYLEPDKGYIVCNGYKDEEFIDLALQSLRLGFRCFFVIETPTELPIILRRARRLGVRPMLGIRVKLAAKVEGHWNESSGDRSIFGLTTAQMVELVDCAARARAARSACSCCTITWVRRSRIFATSGAGCWTPAASTCLSSRRAQPWATSTWAAGWGSITTARRPTRDDSMNYSLHEYCTDVVETI